jgi:hypothetical protein
MSAHDARELVVPLTPVPEKPATLASALAELQTKLPHVAKGETANAGTYSYSYAGLGRVSKDLLPVMGALGLSFSCKPTINADGKFVLAYKLRHAGGEEDAGEWPLPNGSPQQIGSALTYGRRYTLLAITGLAPDEDDDDGKAAADTRIGSVERRRGYDSVEQEVLLTGWLAEIADAPDEAALKRIGMQLMEGRKKEPHEEGALSKPSYDHLAQAGAKRKAELNGAAT